MTNYRLVIYVQPGLYTVILYRSVDQKLRSNLFTVHSPAALGLSQQHPTLLLFRLLFYKYV